MGPDMDNNFGGPFWLWVYFPHSDCSLTGEDIQYPEVSGLEFFGVWPFDPPEPCAFDGFAGIWGKTSVCSRCYIPDKTSEYYGTVRIVTHIPVFPDDDEWPKILATALGFLVSQGAVASWCGAWDLTSSSSKLVEQAPRIYAAYAGQLGLIGNSSTRQEAFRKISSEELGGIQAIINRRTWLRK